MKKILLTAFLILGMPILVLAAPADPDRFPQYTPLLPAPENSQVDYQHPLNSPPPAEIVRPEPGTETGTTRPDVVVASGTVPAVVEVSEPAGPERTGSYGKAILIFSCALLLGYGIWRIRYSKHE